MLKVSDVEKLQKSSEILWESPIYLMNEPNSNFDTFAWKTQLMIDENQVQLIIINGFELFEELVDSEKEEYRDREKEEEAQFHIAKNLNGWTGIVGLTYNPKTMSFKKESDE